MLNLGRFIIPIILLLSLAKAISQELVERPELKVGDRWTFQLFDGRFDEGSFTIEVSEKTTAGYSLVSKDVTARHPVPSSFTSDLNWINPTIIDRTAPCWFSFPMAVGREWTCKTTWVNTGGDSGEDDIKWKVVQQEKITVKAGTFDTIRIVGEGRWKNITRGGSDLSSITVWFSPVTKGPIRYQRENWPKIQGNPQTRMELLSYSQ